MGKSCILQGNRNDTKILDYMMYNKRGIIPHKLLIIDPFERPEIFLKNPSGEESIINKEENESDGIFTMRTPRRATVPKQVNRIMGIRLGK